MAAQQLTNDEQKLLAKLPVDGRGIGNMTLKAELRWSQKKYWLVRDLLVDKQLARRGHGRGGSLRRMVASAALEGEAAGLTESGVLAMPTNVSTIREADLYEPLLEVLRNEWGKDARSVPLRADNVAQGGSKPTGGRWTRPDLLAVQVKTYEYVPGKFLEVAVFEVKPSDQIDVTAVYEALAQRRAATHAYVVLHVPAFLEEALAEQVTTVVAVARAHGVGVVTFADPADYDSWETLADAERVEPDPERLDDFIRVQLPPDTRTAIAEKLR
ncbi:hypothetical protein HQ325_15280 [Rhodococcus sp. BP-349]|uniref:hypothetical protein n=1 Tax=unclassified Rhodococcus (in: high G+C Gram-positive bacteria) TaxID=192944 RepID=UPI001C9AF109|nr:MULTISPECIES: hypothetical protein [unclassified Rhodococcus (in: high G+C Gram-positive bacteria)]MBY6540037.1 hypothetical protein [Rhodococcus sp. BP-363]MBY6543635.1 hypothetical protein [Rhodococcus sp. BP-369]MBY6562865.1 hypothetical protein [Rhodococcus sp. BP-370]MBY6577157.1 hypothetical protein [Rhodococcus sp. BP-364]MBY6586458.1 hypothetical protein [Rhodococcus sp. BP-358]